MTALTAKAKQSNSVEVVSEGQDIRVRALRDGSLSTVDFIAGLAVAGRVFVANLGTVTGPATFGAGDIDGTEFDLHVAVPANTTIIPLELLIQMEGFGTILIFEAMAAYGISSVTGVGTSVTPLNANTQSNIASGCTITGAATASSGTALSKSREFWRDGHQLAVTSATAQDTGANSGTHFRWSWTDIGVMHLVGPSAQLAVFAAAQASAGFITLVYAETPSSWWA